MENGGTQPPAIREPVAVKLSARLEQALIEGDLKSLSVEERVEFYNATCRSLGLNPLTKPFGYIVLNGKLTLYAQKACTDQLRECRGVSITELREDTKGELYEVWATARDATGRTDCDLGSVSIKNLSGENLSNAKMKAVTKAKRRVTLSICGLGMLDETEVTTIPGAKLVGEDAQPAPVLVRARRLSDAPKPPEHHAYNPTCECDECHKERDRREIPPKPLTLTPEENAKIDRELAKEDGDQGGLFTDPDPAQTLRDADEKAPQTFVTGAQIGELAALCDQHGVTLEAFRIYLKDKWGITTRKRIPRVMVPALRQWIERQSEPPPPRDPKPHIVLTRRPPRPAPRRPLR